MLVLEVNSLPSLQPLILKSLILPKWQNKRLKLLSQSHPLHYTHSMEEFTHVLKQYYRHTLVLKTINQMLWSLLIPYYCIFNSNSHQRWGNFIFIIVLMIRVIELEYYLYRLTSVSLKLI